jgi:hypothetical protein
VGAGTAGEERERERERETSANGPAMFLCFVLLFAGWKREPHSRYVSLFSRRSLHE